MKKNLSSQSSAVVETISSTLEHLDKVEKELGSDAPTLTSDEKKRSTKARKGGEHVVGQIAAVMKTHGMDSSAFDVDAMTEKQEIANRLAPLESRLTKLLAQVTARRFEAASAAWTTALECYAVLQRRAAKDGALAANLAPIEAFFAYRHNDVLDAKPTKLQTRAKAKLARAEKLLAHARDRVGAIDATQPGAPQPVAAPAPVTVPAQQAPIAAPVAQPAQPAPVTQMYVPKSNGTSNGVNGLSLNGLNGVGSTG